MSINKEQVKSALSQVLHPEEQRDLISLDMVQDVIVQDKYISFTLEFPEKNEGLEKQVTQKCEEAIQKFIDKEAIVDIQTAVNLSKKREMEASKPGQQQEQQQEILQGVKNIIAVASGKGGVGKSTVAVNIAAALAKKGEKVGLMDTDIYGPSIPTMFNIHERPNITTQKKLVPHEKFGIKLVSMGFLVDVDQAMVWRGPMATSAVKQFMTDVEWGELDYLILDLPPGTGDIQLTIVQTVPLTGAVIVSTPQTVALDDARKGVAMFKKVNVPVLGMVENMAYFTPPDMPDKKYYIFGKGGAAHLAQEMNVPVLAEVPLQQTLREGGDSGKPIVLEDSESPAATALMEATGNMQQQLALRNKEQSPTKKVDIKFRP
ncbi:MAG: Mrp/NBP35 family ATP-binding protein [Gracilimonas sp.]|uniref:Mrp/NBP35 family ATP-binding protein n=1 Tax=Gracilimonas TaxID=649462 RepID=UPI001AFFC9B1|nr:Mrp/NBP35 family ATP-binding protein [Gracilimonas sp.]MBO6585054.1 Mrp/NBP35 family ATP-binding protein [Gracilimonas sp.]MBO6615675.1 Mrp/NBP35 family ATP-binding protein [Gracilimonas sp.]